MNNHQTKIMAENTKGEKRTRKKISDSEWKRSKVDSKKA
jgi:hypothetical protein